MRLGFRPRALLLLALPGAFSACGSEAPGVAGPRVVPGHPGCVGEACQKVVADTCRSSDSENYCIAVKYLSFQNSNGTASASQDLAVQGVRFATQIWSQCKIGFQIQDYGTVDPSEYGLSYGAASQQQTYQIRSQFMENNTFLVVTTGPWPTATVAWTEPPGNDTHGVVQESGVADYPQILAHEFGHYMGLSHIADSPNDVADNVMNWRLFSYSTHLTEDQCAKARAAVMEYWWPMLR